MDARDRQAGFTLIELLLSLSILSIIIVFVFGGLRISARAWEKGDRVLAAQQRSRTILDRLARQLASASVLINKKTGKPLVPFSGDSRTMEFTSGLPFAESNPFGSVYAKYAAEVEPGGKMRLLLYEKTITIEDILSKTQLEHETDGLVLVGNIEGLRFEYLDSLENGFELNWTSSWQFRELTELPRAVRIIYEDRHVVKVVVRIHAWEES